MTPIQSQSQEIEALIQAGLPCHRCVVSGDGRHWQAHVVSDAFEGKRAIQRHQMVYAALGEKMHTDEIHALSIKAQTRAEAGVGGY